jgi:hypothetical protein
MMAVSTSETPVNFYQTTQRNIPENSHLHTHRRENLKSHQDTHTLYILKVVMKLYFKTKIRRGISSILYPNEIYVF